MLFHCSFEGTQYAPPEKKSRILARFDKVQRAIVVTSVIRLPVQIPVPFT